MAILRQAGSIPFRLVDGGDVEFLLITSKKGNWIFPKGIIEKDETPAMTAEKETREEAGIEGEVIGESVGSYEYSKWDRELHVEMFILRYRGEVTWEEADFRERRWCSYAEASELLKRRSLKKLLDVARARILPPV